MWNVYNRPYNLRTTNICESWHSSWNREIARIRPSFWTIIYYLKIQEKRMRLVFGRIEKGEKPPAQKFKWRQLNAKIRRLGNSYELELITLDVYLNNIAVVTHNL